MKAAKDKFEVYATDGNIKYFVNSLMPAVDMTDYEKQFSGFDQTSDLITTTHLSTITKLLLGEPMPQKDSIREYVPIESPPLMARNKTHQEYLEAKKLEEESGGDEEEEEEEEGDEGSEEAEDAEAAEETVEEVIPQS